MNMLKRTLLIAAVSLIGIFLINGCKNDNNDSKSKDKGQAKAFPPPGWEIVSCRTSEGSDDDLYNCKEEVILSSDSDTKPIEKECKDYTYLYVSNGQIQGTPLRRSFYKKPCPTEGFAYDKNHVKEQLTYCSCGINLGTTSYHRFYFYGNTGQNDVSWIKGSDVCKYCGGNYTSNLPPSP